MGGNLFANYGEAVAMILFGIGFSNLLLQKNLIKKIIGLNIMDTATYLSCRKRVYCWKSGTDSCQWEHQCGNVY